MPELAPGRGRVRRRGCGRGRLGALSPARIWFLPALTDSADRRLFNSWRRGYSFTPEPHCLEHLALDFHALVADGGMAAAEG